jgi:hypothetical protein
MQRQSKRCIPTQPNPSNLPLLLIRSTSRRRHPETHPPPPLSMRELGSPARCASQGLVRGRCPVADTAIIRRWASTRTTTTHSRPWRIPITSSLLETEDHDPPPRAHRPATVPISSPLLSPPPCCAVYLNFIFLLLLHNCLVSGWGGGAPRPVLLGGSADQGRREVLTFIGAQVRRKSYLKVFHLVADLP